MSRRILTALPVFNEEQHILGVLDEVRKYAGDILVVDDGSSDRTGELLATQTDLQIVTHEINQGYGAALKSAFSYGIEQGYDVLVTIDCDGQHEPKLIPEMAAAVFPEDAEPVDIVSGSRYLQTFSGDSVPPEDRRRINMQITEIINERLGLNLTDTFCGFKAYRVESLKVFDITELGYAMPLQHWVQAVAAGLRIVEFPVPLIYLEEERSFGGSLDDASRRMAYYQEVLERELAAHPVH
ncbi:MAG: glycosyltransferase family 2 protein [Planctomycetes bacterium]|nr:glycosyltransferase family 2 protein [Planctomycetota bacterium]